MTKFIQRRDDPTDQHEVLDEGTRTYTIADTNNELISVLKTDYEPVPELDPAWCNITAAIRVDTNAHRNKHSLFLGHKRIGYLLVPPPYRVRQTGEYLVVEKPDVVC